MRKLALIILAICGGIVDSYFMFVGFRSEGHWLPIALLACVTITGLSAFLFAEKKYLLFSLIFTYSVLSTNAGQYQLYSDYKSQHAGESIEYNEQLNQREIIQKQIEANEKKLVILQESINQIDKEKYLGWYISENNKKGKIQDEIIKLNEKLLLIKIEKKTAQKALQKNKFQFYSFGNNSAEVILTFVFQIIFSVISALCAPYALASLNEKKQKEIETELEDSTHEQFLRIAMSGILSGKNDYFLPKNDLIKTAAEAGIKITPQGYTDRMNRLIDGGKIHLVNGFYKLTSSNKTLQELKIFLENS